MVVHLHDLLKLAETEKGWRKLSSFAAPETIFWESRSSALIGYQEKWSNRLRHRMLSFWAWAFVLPTLKGKFVLFSGVKSA